MDSKNAISIMSAKKRDDRGLDRLIKIEDCHTGKIRKAIALLAEVPDEQKENLHNVARMRLARFVAKEFPRRRAKPSLYTLRHQMGSDLKSSGMPETKRSAIMGHRSTQSIQVYGNSKSGKQREILVSKSTTDKVTTVVNARKIPNKLNLQKMAR